MFSRLNFSSKIYSSQPLFFSAEKRLTGNRPATGMAGSRDAASPFPSLLTPQSTRQGESDHSPQSPRVSRNCLSAWPRSLTLPGGGASVMTLLWPRCYRKCFKQATLFSSCWKIGPLEAVPTTLPRPPKELL